MDGALSRLDEYLQRPLDSDGFEHSDECSTNVVDTINCGCVYCPDARCDIYLVCKGCHQADMAGF